MNTVTVELIHKLQTEHIPDDRISTAHAACSGALRFTLMTSADGKGWVQVNEFDCYADAKAAALKLSDTQFCDVRVIATVDAFVLRQVSFQAELPAYSIQYDEQEPPFTMHGLSLAVIANKVRGKAKRIRVWSPAGVQLIDTKFGDTYKLVG